MDRYNLTNAQQPGIVEDWAKPRYMLPGFSYLNPWKIAITAAYGLLVLALLVLPAYQLGYAYFSREGLDVSSTNFIGPAIIFLLMAGSAATMLRRLALSLSLKRQASQETIVAGYRSQLSPVEAGVLLDAYSNKNEVRAVVSQLVSKKVIWFETVEGVEYVRYVGTNHGLSRDETVFVESLFVPGNSLPMSRFKPRFYEAGQRMRQAAFKRLTAQGYLPPMTNGQKFVYFATRFILFTGGFLTMLLFFAMFSPDTWVILYPRYPVAEWQLGFILIQAFLIFFLPLQAYYSNIYSGKGMQQYREAAGLYLFIKTALNGRFTDGKLAKSELDYYLPYAYAFGLAEPEGGKKV